jgi:4-amino-4-deoxy-L-arabinose transferase-like glycosyltransferase
MIDWTPQRHRRLAIAVAIVAVGVRLIAIQQPFVDNWSWRQADVASIARNFYTNGFHFAYPQIDWAGDAAGYVGTEFPILPFIAAICYKAVGVHEWIGRLQTILFFAASLPFFYLLVRRLFGPAAAAWALVFYSFAPVNVVASRAFMPDVPSLSLAIAALYLLVRWRDTNRSGLLFASAVLVSLSLLIKLPTAVIGAPILCLFLEKNGRAAFKRAETWWFAAIALLPAAAWYWHAHNVAATYYPYHMFGAGGVRLMSPGWYAKIAVETATSTLTPALFALGVLGVWATRNRKEARLFHWWLVAMLLFIIVVGWGNRHQWYRLPLVPIFAALGGCALVDPSERARARGAAFAGPAAALLLLFLTWSYRYAAHLYEPSAEPLRKLGLALKAKTAPGALLVAADDGDPTVFYYAERKGWHFLEKDGVFDGNPVDGAQLIADLEKLRARGATHLVFHWSMRWWLEYYADFADHVARTSKLIEKTPKFSIYELNPTTP